MDILILIMNNLQYWVFMALSIFAVIGAVLAASTREDAFRAGDRKNKWSWVGFLAVSAVGMMLPLPFIPWIGAVVTGIYWFDVRPQLRAIINGDYSY